MSFQRKTVSLTNNSAARGAPITPNRGLPARGPGASPVTARGPIPGRTAPVGKPPEVPVQAVKGPSKQDILAASIQRHVAVKTSIQISDIPIVSTGSPDLDTLLAHNGLPIGSLLLVEESGNTDFASLILRSSAAQSVYHSRLASSSDKTAGSTKDDIFATKVITVGAGESWGGELPGEYRDKKQAKRDQIEKEQNKLSVQNSNMKIAWRYDRKTVQESEAPSALSLQNKPHFYTTLDFTSRLIPGPAISREIDYVGSPLYFMGPQAAPGSSYLTNIFNKIKSAVEQTLKMQGPNTIIRIIIPSLLHPATYPPESSDPSEITRFLRRLQQLAKADYPANVVVMASIALELYPRDSYLTRWIETLNDGVVHIDPFPEKLDVGQPAVSVSASTSEPEAPQKNKPYQGLVHVYKLPILSERGGMHVRKNEYAFRVSRKKFEIDEWGIPVEEEDEGEKQPQKPATDTKQGKDCSCGGHGDGSCSSDKEKPKSETEPRKKQPIISQISKKDLDF